MPWNLHISHDCGKLRSVSYKVFMPFSGRKYTACALCYSVLRYGITLFGKCAELWQIEIHRIWKSFLKSVGYPFEVLPDVNVFEFLQALRPKSYLYHYVKSRRVVPKRES